MRGFWALLLCKIYMWVLFSVLVPEMLAAYACMEYLHASSDVRYMEDCKKRDADSQLPWSSDWTLKHSFFALMGGFKLQNGTQILSGQELYENDPKLVRELDMDRLEVDISDKSKANLLAKLFSVLQLFQFAFEIGSRFLTHHPISPLEGVTCAYCVCAFITYLFWIEKPYDVEEVIYLGVGSPYIHQTKTAEDGGPSPSSDVTSSEHTDSRTNLQVPGSLSIPNSDVADVEAQMNPLKPLSGACV